MRQSFKVSFYLRSNYENKEGKSPVMLRIFLGGAMSNLGSTKIFVDKAQWNSRTSRQKGRSSEDLAVNASLDAISASLHSLYHKYQDDQTISLDKLRSVYLALAEGVTNGFVFLTHNYLRCLQLVILAPVGDVIQGKGKVCVSSSESLSA